jgi:hypothetical protein
MKRVKIFLFFLPAIIFSSIMVKPAGAAIGGTETFEAQKDTYANEAYPDDAKGSIGSIIVSNKFTTRLGYLSFSDVHLSEGAVLNQAILKIYVHERNYADHAKVNVGPITGDWEESTLTWNHKPTINQTQAIEAEISLTEDGWKEINVTDIVQRWLEGTTENKGLFIYPLGYLYGTTETEFALSFKSRESGESVAKLELEYHLPPTPTPQPEADRPLDETTPTPGATPTETGEPTSTPQLEATPTPEVEATQSSFLTLNLSPGQAVLAGLLLLALIGSVVGFALTSRPKRSKTKSISEKKKKENEEKEEEE